VNIYTKTLHKLYEPGSVMRLVGESVAHEGGIAVAWLKSQGEPFDAADIMFVIPTRFDLDSCEGGGIPNGLAF